MYVFFVRVCVFLCKFLFCFVCRCCCSGFILSPWPAEVYRRVVVLPFSALAGQIGDLFEALGQSMHVGRDEITRFKVRFCFRVHTLNFDS